MEHEKLFRSRKNKNPEPGFFVMDKAGNENLWKPSIIKDRIMKDDNAVKHALLRIYSFQTDSEQDAGQTHETNNKGFGGHDSEILSSFAEQLKTKGWLSKKQLDITRKRISHYHRQLFGYIIEPLMVSIKKEIGEKNVWELLRYSDYREKLAELAQNKKVEWDKIKPFLKPEQIDDHVADISLSNLGF